MKRGRKPKPTTTRAESWTRLEENLRLILTDAINRPQSPVEAQYVRIHDAISKVRLLKDASAVS